MGLGVYGAGALLSLTAARAGGPGAAAFAGDAGFLAGLAAVGFFAAFLGALFFLAGRAMPRNLPHASHVVKRLAWRGRYWLWMRPSTAGAMVPRRATASTTMAARSGPLSGPTRIRLRAKAVNPSPPRRR